MVVKNKNSILLSETEPINFSVYFQENLFFKKNRVAQKLIKILENRQAIVVVDRNVNKIYGKDINAFFKKAKIDYHLLEFVATENNKNCESVYKICKFAKKLNIKRRAVFVAIGGGITMDVTGFAASIYKRQMAYIRIPTTLVGLVDAGVGIKVGVNFDNSRNFLGDYYAPEAVFCDQTFLNTLAIKDIRAGLYEILKMAMVSNKDFFEQIEQVFSDYLNKNFNHHTNEVNIIASYEMMARLAPNLYEHNLKRLVDFGHTFSQSFEVSTNFKIPHGEAVGVDMMLSTIIALNQHKLSQKNFDRIIQLIKAIGFSKKYQLPTVDVMFDYLENIKIHRNGDLNLVLPNKLGQAYFVKDITKKEIQSAYQTLKKDYLS